MLKKSIILMLSFAFFMACSSSSQVQKDSEKSKKTKIEKAKKTSANAYKDYYNDDLKLYKMGDTIITLKDLRQKYPKYLKNNEDIVLKKKADFLRKQILQHLEKEKIKTFELLLPLERKTFNKTDDAFIKGNKEAKNTLVVFSDFECGYCAKFSKEFEAKLYNNKDIKIVFKNYPLSFHKNALDAAIASVCASKQGQFWAYHDLLFENSSKLSNPLYIQLARELKLDEMAFLQCLTNKETELAVLKDIKEAQALGIKGTPSYFINGVEYQDSRDAVLLLDSLPLFQENPKQMQLSDLKKEDSVLFYENQQPVTLKAFTQRYPEMMVRFNNQLANKTYENLKEIVESDIAAELFTREAKKEKAASTDAYLQALLKKNIKEPTDEDIRRIYEAYKSRLKGATFEQVKAKFKEIMIRQQTETILRAKILKLIEAYKVKSLLLAPKLEISLINAPILGNPKAENTLVVFSDFQCPFCSRLKGTFDTLIQDKNIKVVYKHFPLSFHKQAFGASVASVCAQEQGKFWEFHDKIFKHQAELSELNYIKWAKELKLDLEAFKACASNPKTTSRVQQDLKEGASIGVRGTPSLYINGVQYEKNPTDIKTIIEFINQEKK